jgi:quercetin dioxygenase-like cupin family protein
MTASDQRPRSPPYNVKDVERVIKTENVQALIFTFSPGQSIPWPLHRESTDHYFVLDGVLSISTREPDLVVRRIPAGGTHNVEPETPHLIGNDADTDCRFLLLQGVGTYDWIAVS